MKEVGKEEREQVREREWEREREGRTLQRFSGEYHGRRGQPLVVLGVGARALVVDLIGSREIR